MLFQHASSLLRAPQPGTEVTRIWFHLEHLPARRTFFSIAGNERYIKFQSWRKCVVKCGGWGDALSEPDVLAGKWQGIYAVTHVSIRASSHAQAKWCAISVIVCYWGASDSGKCLDNRSDAITSLQFAFIFSLELFTCIRFKYTNIVFPR